MAPVASSGGGQRQWRQRPWLWLGDLQSNGTDEERSSTFRSCQRRRRRQNQQRIIPTPLNTAGTVADQPLHHRNGWMFIQLHYFSSFSAEPCSLLANAMLISSSALWCRCLLFFHRDLLPSHALLDASNSSVDRVAVVCLCVCAVCTANKSSAVCLLLNFLSTFQKKKHQTKWENSNLTTMEREKERPRLKCLRVGIYAFRTIYVHFLSALRSDDGEVMVVICIAYG